MALVTNGSYPINWNGSERVQLTFSNYAIIQVLSGSISIGPYTAGSKPDGNCFCLLAGDQITGLTGTVGLYNNGNPETDARVLEYT